MIIDGNALIHRSYHAVPKTLRAPDGRLTNAAFGFTGILLGILEQEKPDYLAVAWDMKGPTFRDELFTDYKATRAKTDDELIAQFPMVRRVLEAFSVPCFEKEGLEADDYLGIVSTELVKKHPGMQVVIVTGDKDALQLVGERVTVVSPISGYTKVKRYDRMAVKEKMGVWPEQVPDFKGLSGDPSDNIPGVPGIGEKGAVRLLEAFGSIEGIYKNIDKVKSDHLRALLQKGESAAHLCKKLATIVREDGISVDLKSSRIHNFDIEKVRAVFTEFAFRSALGRVERLEKGWEKLRVDEKQGSLF